jgi:multiple sugar transport system permease protein
MMTEATSARVATGVRTRHGASYWLRIAWRILVYLFTLVLGLMFMLPFFWAVSSAFKPVKDLYVFPPLWFPRHWQPQNFVQVWQSTPFAQWAWNSVKIAAFNVVGEVLTASAVAYGFSRYRFKGRNFLFVVLLSTMMIPIYVTIIPRFMLFRELKWLDTHLPLIVPSFFGGSAFNIFLLRQFFMTIPRDFDEAAYVDGASSWTIFWRVILPLSKPALSTVAVFSFLFSWQSFISPLIYLNSKEKYTLPIGLTWFNVEPVASGEVRDHLLMAASVMVTLPIIVLFFAAQRYFISGIVMSGLKE